MDKNSLKKLLKSMDVSKMKLDNGKTIEQELRHHADILAACISQQLWVVYASYMPVLYKRTFALQHSLLTDSRVYTEVKGTKMFVSVRLGFGDGAWHTGLDGKSINTALLLNEGWQTHGKFADVPYFGFREATHFVDKAIEAYRQSVKNPLDVQINYF
jgi:hypothetical protein